MEDCPRVGDVSKMFCNSWVAEVGADGSGSFEWLQSILGGSGQKDQ